MAHTARTMRRAADLIAEADPAFIPVIESSPLCTIGRKSQGDPFHALVVAIIGQQLSVRAADTITERFHAHLGGSITPGAVLRVDHESMRAVGLSGAKSRTIRGLAEATHTGDLDLDALVVHDDNHHIMGELTKLWGIGRWTAEMFLMFTLHRLDVWPVGDLAMRKGWQVIHRARAKDIDPAKLDRLGRKFAPYRSVAAWYCWRVIDEGNGSDTW
jgi:DNA-3-methyladenine glycosylase II